MIHSHTPTHNSLALMVSKVASLERFDLTVIPANLVNNELASVQSDKDATCHGKDAYSMEGSCSGRLIWRVDKI